MYCSYDDLKKQVPEDVLLRYVSDPEGNLALDKVTSAIEQAQAEIDAYCGGLYKVPFSSPPGIIRKYTVDIALYHLFSGHGFNFASESADRIIYVRYKDAIEFLKLVAANKIDLFPGGGSTDPDGIGTANLRISSEKRIFGRSNMSDF